MYKLIEYIQNSKLAYKIEGYAAQAETQGNENGSFTSRSTPVLHTLLSFLVSLNNLSSEGRIFYHKVSQNDIKLSYLLLSPTHAFSSIASSARAVILAGGTMSPFEDYTAHLFPDMAESKITTLSCGHVIPASSLCVWTLASSGPKGNTRSIDFEFSFQKRRDKSMVRDLGLAILNICTAVPDGVVVFFPSYGYLDEVVAAWTEASPGQANSLWDRLQTKKAVFRESKGGSSDEVLEKYTEAILGDENKTGSNPSGPKPGLTGGLLLSVVGGKMSEGINFSDRLGRCVVVVGLPYPNINSPDWKARIEYIESTTVERLTKATPAATDSTNPTTSASMAPKTSSLSETEAKAKAKQVAREFYENACMRAVNQSIGRAIRHRGDYAAIVLIDRRFATARIRSKLPGWIRGGLVEGSEDKGLGQMMGKLNGFFREKKAGTGV